MFSELVPADLEQELKHLYMSLCELFRHFWTSFPPTTPTLEAKADRMHEALHQFHSARLKPFEVRYLKHCMWWRVVWIN
jgi:transcription initiation factor TFIIH subunit 1